MTLSLDTIINPSSQTVNLVESDIDTSGIGWIGNLIEARMFTFVRLYDNGDGVYIDDEGLYAEQRHFFIHRNYPQPLVNKGLFVGIDDEGETTPPKTPFKTLENDIRFIGDDHDLRVMLMFMKSKIATENGYEDYRPIYF